MTIQDTAVTTQEESADLQAREWETLTSVRVAISNHLAANDYQAAFDLTANTYAWLVDMRNKYGQSYGELAEYLSEWWRVNTNPCS